MHRAYGRDDFVYTNESWYVRESRVTWSSNENTNMFVFDCKQQIKVRLAN